MTAADFSRIALSLEGVEEYSHSGLPAFRVRGGKFASLASQAEGYGNLMLTLEQQAAFVEEAPEIFLPIPGGWGKMGHTHIRLAAASEDVLAGALRTAWKLRIDKNAARLLYGMGSHGALPRLFAFVNPSTSVPSRNVLICGAIALMGAWAMSYQLSAELLNFGAFLAFAGVNAASFRHYWWKGNGRTWSHAAIPVCGFAVCLYIWLSLRPQAKLGGLVWITLGCLYFTGRQMLKRRSSNRLRK
ncbi:MAG: hypothetical protein ACR2IV_12450 [Bryobacteraceae bacterium]